MTHTQTSDQTYTPPRSDVDDITNRLKWGVNAAMGLYFQMVEGSAKPESWLDGLFYTLTNLTMDVQELRAAVNSIYEEMRRSNEKDR